MKADKIIDAVQGVTKRWAKQRKAEERSWSAAANRRNVMTRRRPHVTVKMAAWMVMEKAYLKASANGALPAHARQIMYAARPYIDREADRDIGDKFDRYFTQTLLPDYIDEKRVNWNVVFDARGHFTEPHSTGNVPLGTLEVRKYLALVKGHKQHEPKFNMRSTATPRSARRTASGASCSSRRKASCRCSRR
jgi:hypothetical protein